MISAEQKMLNTATDLSENQKKSLSLINSKLHMMKFWFYQLFENFDQKTCSASILISSRQTIYWNTTSMWYSFIHESSLNKKIILWTDLKKIQTNHWFLDDLTNVDKALTDWKKITQEWKQSLILTVKFLSILIQIKSISDQFKFKSKKSADSQVENTLNQSKKNDKNSEQFVRTLISFLLICQSDSFHVIQKQRY